jgi:MFS family permease
MPPLLAGAIVFFASAAVLVLEILAVRLLAPHLGVTLEVTTGVIGTVLAGIAAGTWLGGRLADQVDPRRLLGPILILGGVLALAVIPIVGLAARLDLAPDPLGILAFAGAAFFLPAAVLSAASPAVVKLQLVHLGETGTVVGRYSAIGTLGAILGSFATGFVLVAALPTRPIVIVVGLALVLAGAAIATTVGRGWGSGLSVLGLLFAGGTLAWAVAAPGPCERESAYFCIRVVEASADGTERELRMDDLRHAYVDLDDPQHLEFAYTRLLGDVVDALGGAGEPIAALHVGGGGFSMPRYVEAVRPGSLNRVLELDPVVLQTAREELGLITTERLTVALGDARLGLRAERDDAYDLVIGDAFAGPTVPWHLTTREFGEQVSRVLRPRGIYAVNIIDHPPLRLARAQLATLAEVFEHVAVWGPESRALGLSGGNVILLASDAPFPTRALAAANAARGGSDVLSSDAEAVARFIGDGVPLTDDFAPADQLMTR